MSHSQFHYNSLRYQKCYLPNPKKRPQNYVSLGEASGSPFVGGASRRHQYFQLKIFFERWMLSQCPAIPPAKSVIQEVPKSS